jgi:hypothetical protein
MTRQNSLKIIHDNNKKLTVTSKKLMQASKMKGKEKKEAL